MINYLKRLLRDKKEYREMMARVKVLPDDYRFVYKKIQDYMWKLADGDGLDILKVQYDLIDLFEEGVTEGKSVLEVTGEDVANFSDELLLNAKTYTKNWRQELNSEIAGKLGKRGKLK